MARAYGNSPLTHLGFKRESAYGVDPGGNYLKLPFVSISLSGNQELEPSDLLGQGRGPGDPTLGILRVAGEAVVPADMRTSYHWFALGLGDPTLWSDYPSASLYTRRFASDKASLPSASIEIGLGQVPAYTPYRGIMVNSIRGDVLRTGQAVWRLQLVGQIEGATAATSGAGTLTLPPAERRLANRQAALERDGSALASVLSGDWEINNGLIVVETIRADEYVEAWDPGPVGVTGSLQTRFASTTLVDLAVAGTASKIAAIYSYDADETITFQARRVFLPRPSRALSGPGGVDVPFAWQASRATLSAPANPAAAASNGGSLVVDTYYYKIAAVDVNGYTSPASAEVSASAASSDLTIDLEWDEVDGAVAYNIYRSLVTADYGVNALLVASVTALTYSDDGTIAPVPGSVAAALAEGGSLAEDEFFYVVAAVDSSGHETLQSAEDSATTTGTTLSITLTWTAVSGAATYKVYRSTTTATYGASSLLKSGITGVTYTDTGADSLVSGTPVVLESEFLLPGTPSTQAAAVQTAEIILVNDVATY